MFKWKLTLTLLGVALIIASSPGSPSLASDPLPDLVVYITITGPSSVNAGEPIGHLVTVTVDNLGSVTANGTTPDGARRYDFGYTVEIVLSSDREVPIAQSTYQAKFREDVQLSGGSIPTTYDVEPNFMRTVWEANSGRERDLEIPTDTPSGDYFVCAVVDPGRTVDETDESNNFDCALLSVVGREPAPTRETPSPSPEPPNPSSTPGNVDEPTPFIVPELANPITLLTLDEDSPDLTIDLSRLLGDEYAPVDWAAVRSNNNPTIVSAGIVRGKVLLQFAKNRHGAAQITVDGVDEDGFLFGVSLFLEIEPINDAPVVKTPLGEMMLHPSDGDVHLDLLQVFQDVDLHSNQDRLTFKLTNDNTALLSFSLQNSDLTLHPQPNQHGEANLSITATDQWGLSAMDTLRIVVEPTETPVTHSETGELPAQTPANETHTDDSKDDNASNAGSETITPNVPPLDQPSPSSSPDSSEEPGLAQEPDSSEEPDSPEEELEAPADTGEPTEAMDPFGTIGDEVVPVAVSIGTQSQKPLEPGEAVDEQSRTPSPIVTFSPTPSPGLPIISLPLTPASVAPLPSPPTSMPEPESTASKTHDLTPVADLPKSSPLLFPTSVPGMPSLQPDVVNLTSTTHDRSISGPALIAIIALGSVGALAVMALTIRIRRRAGG